MKKLIVIISVCLFALIACKKKEDNSILNSFISLTAEKDTLFTGQSTKITAVIDGENVSFKWTATAGDLLGSGSEVTYVAPTCTPGNNQVSCEASAANNTETKSIIITVF